jgi:hypothetical protein
MTLISISKDLALHLLRDRVFYANSLFANSQQAVLRFNDCILQDFVRDRCKFDSFGFSLVKPC